MSFFLIPTQLIARWTADTMQGDWRVLVFGPSLVAGAYGLTVVFYLGIAGLQLTDGRREWWARLGAYLLLMSLGWLTFSSIIVFGPDWLYRLSLSSKITLTSLWAVLSAVGTKFANDPRTGGKPPSKLTEKIREAVITLAPNVFVLGLLLLLSVAVQFLVESSQGAGNWRQTEGSGTFGEAAGCSSQPRQPFCSFRLELWARVVAYFGGLES